MNLLQRWNRARTTRQIKILADRASRQSIEDIHHRLDTAVHAMPLAEARGYIRARAGKVVREQIQHVLAGEGRLPAWGEQELQRRATSEAVNQVVSGLHLRPLPNPVRRAG